MTDTDYLKYQRKLNSLLAMPLYVYPMDMSARKITVYLMTVYQLISEAIVIVVTCAQLWAVPHVFEDMNVLCGCLSSGSHSVQVAVKTACLRFYKKKFMIHLDKTNVIQDEINDFELTLLKKTAPGFRDYQAKKSRYVRVVATLQLLTNFASTSAYFIPSVYNSLVHSDEIRSQLLPIVIYLGFDLNVIPVFQIAAFVLTIGFYIINLKTVVLDNFILNVIVLHMSQLKYHNRILKEINQTFKAKGSDYDVNKELIRNWIRQHQTLLSLYDDFQRIISPYLFMEFSYVFFHTCVPAFVITATFSWTTPQKVAVFFMVGGGLTTLFLMSVAGDSFCQEWQESGQVLFDSGVVSKDDSFMKNVYLMIQRRLQRPFRLSALTVLPLNCATFMTIVRLIFSYYITLNEIQKMKHNDVSE